MHKACLGQLSAQIVVGHPTIRIILQGCAIKRYCVAVDRALLTGERRERADRGNGRQSRRPAGFFLHTPAPQAPRRRGQCNRPDNGDVQIVVRHQGVLHEAHVHKSQHRRQSHAEKSPGKQYRPAPGISIPPQHGRNGQRGQKRQPPQQFARVDGPLRINKRQMDRQ